MRNINGLLALNRIITGGGGLQKQSNYWIIQYVTYPMLINCNSINNNSHPHPVDHKKCPFTLLLHSPLKPDQMLINSATRAIS